MLIAAYKNKLKIHRHHKVKLVEDEFTSTIFGPLLYFKAKDVFYFFESLILPKFKNKDIWHGYYSKIEGVDVNFWPSLISKRGSKTEPDLLIQFFSNKAVVRISSAYPQRSWNIILAQIFPCNLHDHICQLVDGNHFI